MGATWKYETMFGSTFLPDNFESLLNSHGIETYSVDYGKDDTFNDVVSACKEIHFDYVMGYSLGCFLAIALANQSKGIILLDPNSHIDHSQQKYIQDIDTANKFFDSDIENKNHNVHTTLDFSLIKPTNKKTLFLFSEYGKNNNSLMTDSGKCFRMLRNKTTVVIPESSHYIMLESKRFEAAKIISEFIDA